MKDILGRELTAGDLILRLTNSASGLNYYGLVIGQNQLCISDFKRVKNHIQFNGGFKCYQVYFDSVVYKVEQYNEVEQEIKSILIAKYQESIIKGLKDTREKMDKGQKERVGDLFYSLAGGTLGLYLYLGKGKISYRCEFIDCADSSSIMSDKGYIYYKLEPLYKDNFIDYLKEQNGLPSNLSDTLIWAVRGTGVNGIHVYKSKLKEVKSIICNIPLLKHYHSIYQTPVAFSHCDIQLVN